MHVQLCAHTCWAVPLRSQLPGLGISPQSQLRVPRGSPGPAPSLGGACAGGEQRVSGLLWGPDDCNGDKSKQTSVVAPKDSAGTCRTPSSGTKGAGPHRLRQMEAGGVTAGTVPEVTAATLSLFLVQGKSGSVKSLSLRWVRNSPPSLPAGEGQNASGLSGSGICETFQWLLVRMDFPGLGGSRSSRNHPGLVSNTSS